MAEWHHVSICTIWPSSYRIYILLCSQILIGTLSDMFVNNFSVCINAGLYMNMCFCKDDDHQSMKLVIAMFEIHFLNIAFADISILIFPHVCKYIYARTHIYTRAIWKVTGLGIFFHMKGIVHSEFLTQDQTINQ